MDSLTSTQENNLLEINQLSVRDEKQNKTLLNNINLRLKPNNILAIVGESGSGKSTLAKAVLNLLADNLTRSGEILFNQQPISEIKDYLGKKIGLITQNAMTAFDPLMTIEKQLKETLLLHSVVEKSALTSKIAEQFSQVNLPTEVATRYPSQLSGGQLQRVMIALTLMMKPQLVIADEPTSALDCVTQFEMLPLFKTLRQQSSVIFITHDLALARALADEIAVFHKGELVEWQKTADLFSRPLHSYTTHLLHIHQKLSEKFNRLIY